MIQLASYLANVDSKYFLVIKDEKNLLKSTISLILRLSKCSLQSEQANDDLWINK